MMVEIRACCAVCDFLRESEFHGYTVCKKKFNKGIPLSESMVYQTDSCSEFKLVKWLRKLNEEAG